MSFLRQKWYDLTVRFAQVQWILSTWRFVPPWTKFLIRRSLTRHQYMGDEDRIANLLWSWAFKLTWDKASAGRYAAHCLTYGL